MKKFIGSTFLSLTGWTTYYPTKYRTSKSVIITAPHTSSMDYIYGIAAFWKRGIKVKFLYNDKDFPRYISCFFRFIGGIEAKGKGVTKCSIDLLNKSDELMLIMPVEGSKKFVNRWRTGFYHVASATKIPVTLSYLDYESKIAGIGDLFEVSDVIENDFRKIQNFYKNFTPKNPENYNSNIY